MPKMKKPQTLNIIDAMALLFASGKQDHHYGRTRSFPPWTRGPMTPYQAQSHVVASVVRGGGVQTRQRRRLITRECFKAGEDPVEMLEIFDEYVPRAS
jgi:hypothetical protein